MQTQKMHRLRRERLHDEKRREIHRVWVRLRLQIKKINILSG